MNYTIVVMKKIIFFLVISLLSFCQLTLSRAMEDSIDFFNVGQGYVVLVNKAGAEAPLLIDAGSTSHPSKMVGPRYEWASQEQNSLASPISERIWEIWNLYIFPWRQEEGKTFKEISKSLIEWECSEDEIRDCLRCYKNKNVSTKEKLYEKLENYFPSAADNFLS